jgi:hypothetical protein
MIHRGVIRVLVACAAAAFLTLRPGIAEAAEPNVAVTATPADNGTWLLAARVSTPDGDAASQVSVTFTAATEFFGERWVPVGTAVTDTSGTASLIYTPTWNGAQTLVAVAAGADGTVASQPIVIEVRGAIAAVPAEPPALPIVRSWALPIGAAVVIAVWIVLAFPFLKAVVGIARRPALSTAFRSHSDVDGMRTVESTVDGGSRT